MEISFILPTYNRKKFIGRAIDSCLQINIESKFKIKAFVIVLDGFSQDGTWEYLNENYKENNKVKLIQVSKSLGFQRTAFYGVSFVKTEFCTFMYDDDVLSKYYHLMLSRMIISKQNFIMGYGINFDVRRIYNFSMPTFKKTKTLNIILNYYGYFDYLKYTSLPVSPIASISKTSFLLNWINEVKEFVQFSSFREDLLIRQNIGPDLIIYLSNLINNGEEIEFCESNISQLSFHKDSMSIKYGKEPLSTGYWLARIFGVTKYQKNKIIDYDILSKMFSYLLVSGFFILLLNIKKLNFSYSKNILFEIIQILKKTKKNKIIFKTLKYIPKIVSYRLKRDINNLTPV